MLPPPSRLTPTAPHVPFHSLLPYLLQLGLQSVIATVAKFSLSYWMEEVARTGS